MTAHDSLIQSLRDAAAKALDALVDEIDHYADPINDVPESTLTATHELRQALGAFDG